MEIKVISPLTGRRRSSRYQQGSEIRPSAVMAVVDENWQTMRSSIKERVMFLLNKDILSDVKFVVPSGESESKKVISAHKFVLAISSPVFFAMFYGKMAETTDSIELPDCDYESLLELFRFMYTDEANLSGNNVIQVSYLAKKYMVPSLVGKCAEYLRDSLDASNLFSVVADARKFEDNDLEDVCWEMIEKQTKEALRSDEFVTVERSVVESVVTRERLSVTEMELFKAVDRWATKESERQGKTPGDAKRKILGEEIVKAIRFPLMTEKDFISVVPDCSILTTTEIIDIIKHYNDVLTTPLQFSSARRVNPDTTIYHCRRFEDLPLKAPTVSSWWYKAPKKDRICFTVNKPIQLLGIQHFGSERGLYEVSAKVKDITDGSSVVRKSGSYTSKEHQTDQCYYGFDVLFDQPVYLEQNKRYEIVSLITGPHSWFGKEGKASVECGEVVFSLSDSDAAEPHRTFVSQGQFPALLFRKA